MHKNTLMESNWHKQEKQRERIASNKVGKIFSKNNKPIYSKLLQDKSNQSPQCLRQEAAAQANLLQTPLSPHLSHTGSQWWHVIMKRHNIQVIVVLKGNDRRADTLNSYCVCVW